MPCGQLCYPIDLTIAIDHITLRAVELGLGTCWIGWFNEKGVKRELKIPKNKKVDAIISLGYAEQQQPQDKIRKPLNEMSEFR